MSLSEIGMQKSSTILYRLNSVYSSGTEARPPWPDGRKLGDNQRANGLSGMDRSIIRSCSSASVVAVNPSDSSYNARAGGHFPRCA